MSEHMVGRQHLFPFIVGCMRSGTTMLRAMLDSHPEMAIPQESYFVVSMGRHRRKYERSGGFDTEPFATDLVGHAWFQRWGLSESETREALSATRPRDYPDAVRSVYQLYADRQGKTRYGDKTPAYVLNLRLIGQLFPEARFVHVIRDGRDVALALLEVAFGPRTIDEAALTWRRMVKRGRRMGRVLGARYCEVRYEDLVAQPEQSLVRICDFLDLDFQGSMLRYFERAEELLATFPRPEPHRNLTIPPTRGLRDWKRQMGKDDLILFEELAGDTLTELGYERASDRPRLRFRLEARRRWAGLEIRRVTRDIYRRLVMERG